MSLEAETGVHYVSSVADAGLSPAFGPQPPHPAFGKYVNYDGLVSAANASKPTHASLNALFETLTTIEGSTFTVRNHASFDALKVPDKQTRLSLTLEDQAVRFDVLDYITNAYRPTVDAYPAQPYMNAPSLIELNSMHAMPRNAVDTSVVTSQPTVGGDNTSRSNVDESNAAMSQLTADKESVPLQGPMNNGLANMHVKTSEQVEQENVSFNAGTSTGSGTGGLTAFPVGGGSMQSGQPRAQVPTHAFPNKICCCPCIQSAC